MFIRDSSDAEDSDDLSIDLFGLNHMVSLRDVAGKWQITLCRIALVWHPAKQHLALKNIFDLPFSEGLPFYESVAVFLFVLLLQAKRDAGY